MNVYVEPLRPSRFAVLLERPWVSRLLATVGILLMTVGFYVPIAGRVVLDHSGLLGRYSETFTFIDYVGVPVRELLGVLHFNYYSLLLYLAFLAALSVLALGGLALLPLLWQPLCRRGAALLRRTYASWLVLLILLAVAGLPTWQQFMLQPPLSIPADTSTVEATYLLPGALVLPLGVLVSAAALRLLYQHPLPISLSVPRTAWGWSAALILTLGTLVWGIGFYVMPQTITASCPPLMFSPTQFAYGACAGLNSDQVLHVAYYAGLGPITSFFYTVGERFDFLVAAACITTLGGWTRQLSKPALVWLIAWPVVALGVAFVALDGVGLVAQHGFYLTLASGTGWHIAPGMVVTFVGIGLVVLGQLGLWIELARHQ